MGFNNIADDIFDYTKKIAKDISTKGLNGASHLKRGPEELANSARINMLKKNTVISNLDLAEIDSAFTASAKRGNTEYAQAFTELKTNIELGNVDEVKTVAKSMSERFNDNKYLELLQNAESKHININDQIKKAPSDIISSKFKADYKVPGLFKNFVTDEQAEGLANVAYSLNGGAKQYFNSGNKKTNQVRVGATVGGYFATATTARLLHGGSPITNEYGERDIVGVPFF